MYSRILVGTDGSATAALAVDRAVEVAAATKAPLTILCVDREDRGRKIAEAEAARHAAAGVDITAMAKPGEAASVLVDEAEQGDYDLLVVGNRGMTGASRFLLGSVPNKVSHHASISLLIVRTT